MQKNLQIQSLTISSLRAPLIMPFRVATGSHQTLDNLLVKLQLHNGISGYGEAAVAAHITGETIVQTKKNLKDAAGWLNNKSIADYHTISGELKSRYPHNNCVRAAVEMAIFDALAQHEKIPLWKLFGKKPKKLTTDITIVIGSLKETEMQTRHFFKQGFRAFKIKIGKDEDLDLKRVMAVHRIARHSKIYLDANQGFDAKQTLNFLKQLKKLKISVDMIEQPVKREDRDGLKKVTREGGVAVCADESAKSLDDVAWIIKHKAADVINIKTMKTAIVESCEIARTAKAAGLKLMIGGMMESSLSMTCSAHVAAGLGGFDYIDLDTPFFITGDAQKNPFLSSKGIYTLSKTKPGIGIKI